MIVLPKRISILCEKSESGLTCSEYSLYYRNFIWPFRQEDILRVLCDYGMDLGDCWRLEEVPADVETFPLTFVVYDCEGIEKERATVRIILTEKAKAQPMRIAVIGDSMTHHGTYSMVMAQRLPCLRLIGTRTVNGYPVEGRGGWTLSRYLTQKEHYERGVSPYMFPTEESAENYYGDWDFWQKGFMNPESDPYVYKGFSIEHIQEGQSFIREGKLYRYAGTEETLISETPEFACDYGKYLKRFSLEKPEAISLLFGANEMQKVAFERTEEVVNRTIGNFRLFIESVRQACPGCKVIINLPIAGAEQYAWGKRLGCNWGGKQYQFNILQLCKALLQEYDDREEEGFYISPMLQAIDPVYGFPRETVKKSIYADREETVQCNWVHPSETGYAQMGEALAGTAARVTMQKE